MKQFPREQTLTTRDLLHFAGGSPTGAAYSSSTEAVYSSPILSTAKNAIHRKLTSRSEYEATRNETRRRSQGESSGPRIKPDKERRPGQESNPRERLRNRNGGAQARSGKDEDNGFRGKAQDEQQGHH